MSLRNYGFRNRFKELLCQVYDTLEYPRRHPYTLLRKEAYATTLDFVRERCLKAVPCRSPRQLLDLAIARTKVDGNYVEFGVFRGASIRHIAACRPKKIIHGFDSFEGLPEDWLHNPRSTFSTGGKLPRVPDNVRLCKGYFEDTLPGWVKQNPQPMAFVHIDCDLRSSTATVFQRISPFIRPGTVLLFDDYFNFPGWEQDGHAVFEQVVEEQQWQVRYLGYAFKELLVIVD